MRFWKFIFRKAPDDIEMWKRVEFRNHDSKQRKELDLIMWRSFWH